MKIIEINAETQEVIERDPTPDELAQRELDEAEAQAKILLQNEKMIAKTALLERLGITADEAALLLS